LLILNKPQKTNIFSFREQKSSLALATVLTKKLTYGGRPVGFWSSSVPSNIKIMPHLKGSKIFANIN
jgi:hypothetical protein